MTYISFTVFHVYRVRSLVFDLPCSIVISIYIYRYSDSVFTCSALRYPWIACSFGIYTHMCT